MSTERTMDLRAAALPRWTNLRSGIRYQIVNTDMDGLMTGALLWSMHGWPIIGFSDTERIWIDPWVQDASMLNVIWVDLDMCHPLARTIGQHVVCNTPQDAQDVWAFRRAVNPNLIEMHAMRHAYTTKYPFGTFQWAWWLLDAPVHHEPDHPIANGLAWMPDGGFESVQGVWRDNCLRWATQALPGSILEPGTNRIDRLPHLVMQAEAYLRERSGVTTGWRNHQFAIPRSENQHTAPSPLEPEVSDPRMQRLIDVLCEFYGWPRCVLPEETLRFQGKWRFADTPPPAWPHSANDGRVVSVAATGRQAFCWTEGKGLQGALEGWSLNTDREG